MLAGMSAREFREWMAYDQVEPIGSWRDDARIAQLCLLVATAWSDPKKGRRPTLDDFLPWIPKPETEEPDPDDPEVIAAARLRARMFRAGMKAKRLAPGERPPGWTGPVPGGE
jgi:hypothetical protein